MESEKKVSSSSSSGIGFFGLLTVIFIVGKVFKIEPVADWSWWWVLSPLWIGFSIWLIAFITIFGAALWLMRK